MLRRRILLPVLAASGLVLAACGGSQDTATEETTATEGTTAAEETQTETTEADPETTEEDTQDGEAAGATTASLNDMTLTVPAGFEVASEGADVEFANDAQNQSIFASILPAEGGLSPTMPEFCPVLEEQLRAQLGESFPQDTTFEVRNIAGHEVCYMALNATSPEEVQAITGLGGMSAEETGEVGQMAFDIGYLLHTGNGGLVMVGSSGVDGAEAPAVEPHIEELIAQMG